ncbi:MAG: ABC transporter ATP-binding protein [Proteobacteria bacterium]|nr:ABC transporter ATP-binding protein [Pseudomonadota bacterium]
MSVAGGATIELVGLTKRFSGARGGVAALRSVSARIEPGRITGLVGSDGAGKTTLMRVIAGLMAADEGEVRVENAAEVGYMPQSFATYEDLTVADNLALYADLEGVAGAARRARLDELLAFTGLGPFQARLAGRLSGGMRQKLALACALMRPPDALLLDEPSVGVDPLSRRELWEIVSGLAAKGALVLWSTAYLDEAERCAAVLVLHQGRLVYAGPPGSFTGPLAGRTFALYAPAASLRAVQRRAGVQPGIVDAVRRERALRLVVAEGPAPKLADLLAEDERAGAALEPVRPTFEDALVAALRSTAEPSPTPLLAAPAPIADLDRPTARPVEVANLTRRFDSFVAVDSVSFAVERGEIFGLLGPNGAGKSTIFKVLCGLLPPSGGTALIAGIDLSRARAAARERIGYMSQRFSLYGELSVGQNLAFFAGVYGLSGRRKRERIAAVSAEFGLRALEDERAGALPLGHRQRLALAAALLHEPAILFLDEPTSGVDPVTRREFWLRINALAEAGVTVMVSTHFLEEAEYCDRLAILYEGRLIALGSAADLKRAHAPPGTTAPPGIEDAFIALIRAQARAAA